MNSRWRIRIIDIMVVAGLTGYLGSAALERRAAAPVDAPDADAAFAAAVDLAPLDRVAVQADGRLRSFASHARTYVGFVSGPRAIHDQPAAFSYLDLMFRPARYVDADIIFIKNKLLNQEIIDLLRTHGLDEARAAIMEKSRLIAPSLLRQPAVQRLLDQRGADLVRTAKLVDQIESGLVVARPEFLGRELRLIPPADGAATSAWTSPIDLARAASGDPAGQPGSPQAALDPNVQTQLAQTWAALANAWNAGNAPAVNEKLAALADTLPALQPHLYPQPRRLALESFYFRYGSLTWVWLIYLASVVPLLLAVINKWEGARRLGLSLFVLAFLAQTGTVMLRWYISGRWPNANMFEAVTTSAWFGGVGALILEFFARKTPLRNLFALGSAVVSMAALMAAKFLPTFLDASLNNKMPALYDVWLYIHTNVIIWSYAVIGVAAVTALLLLRHRWVKAWDEGVVPKWRLIQLPIMLAVLNVTGWKVMMATLVPEKYAFASVPLRVAWLSAFGVSLATVLFEGLEARRRRLAGLGGDRSASGGADALIRSRKLGSFLSAGPPSAGQVLDAATMVSMEVAFIMLWSGIVMGAIWADHSWGRPWGWDPKEVFALNTFIIFLVLVHVRLKVKDKAFWTAVLAVVGFQVMMFNWIVINFVISGLHSYA